MIETYRGVVRPPELDHMGHMNVQWYTAKFDEATWHFFAAIGMTPSFFQAENRGMAALEQNTKYFAEVMAGDLLICHTEGLDLKNKTVRYIHHMINTQTNVEVATSELVAAHLDRTIRKACPFPAFVAEKFEEHGWV